MTMNRVVLASVLLGLTAAAIYSYGQLNFGRRTAAFFNVALGAQMGEARPAGGPPQSGRGTGRMGSGPVGPVDGAGRPPQSGRGTGRRGSGPVRPADGGAPPAGTNASDGQVAAARGAVGESPAANQRGPGDGRGGGTMTSVSMTHVLQYSAIMAFVTMLTLLTDRWLLTSLKRARVD
jgi:hypothetical protein